MAAMIYRKTFCTELTKLFIDDLEESTEIDPGIWKERKE